MGPGASMRLKVLKAIRRVSHRYLGWRALGMSFSIAVLLAVPLSGLARVDLWGGRHALLFREASFREGLAGVLVGIAAMYVVTFLSNVVVGRMFCGWGCPVGQVSRFGESAASRLLERGKALRVRLEGALFTAAFVAGMLAWWTDLRVLVLGSPRELAVAWGIVLAGVAAAWGHGRFWRWSFCMQACPIGIYYTFVSPARWFGIYFVPEKAPCIECDACDNVCPVDLAPRELAKPIPARGGLSIGDAPGRNHCLECGDCVRACEFMVGKRTGGPAPLRLGFHVPFPAADVPRAEGRREVA